MSKTINVYCYCGIFANWVRSTQFAGDHYFCQDCAEKEEDFCKDDWSSYFYWLRIENVDFGSVVQQPEHYLTVPVLPISDEVQKLVDNLINNVHKNMGIPSDKLKYFETPQVKELKNRIKELEEQNLKLTTIIEKLMGI